MKNLTLLLILSFVFLFSSCNLAPQSNVYEAHTTNPGFKIQPTVRLSPENTSAAEPSIAAASDKTLYVVWVEHREKSVADLKIAHLSETGTLLGEPVRVNPNPGEVRAWSGDQPTLAVDKDGKVFVGWTRIVADGEKHGTDLLLSVSNDAGRTFSAPVRVNDDKKPAQHGMHALAVALDGRVVMTWLDERNVDHQMAQVRAVGFHAEKIAMAEPEMEIEPNSEIYSSFSTDSGKTFSPNKLISKDTCPCCKTNLAVADDGQIFVAWRQVVGDNFRHIAVASSSDGGESFSKPVIVSDDRWQIMGCPVSGPSLSISKEKALRVAWFTSGKAGEPGYYLAESTDGGKSFSDRKEVAGESSPGTPTLNVNAGSGFIVWQGFKDGSPAVLIRRFDPVNSEFSSEQVSVAEGLLPVAVETEEGVGIVFGKRDGETQGVYFVGIIK